MLTVPDSPPALAEMKSRKYRFTSNVIASIVITADIACLILGSVLAVMAYAILAGRQYFLDMHVTVAVIVAVNFLLIRLSRDSYSHPMGRGQDSDQGVVFEFLIAAILVFATVWQLGLATLFSPGLGVCYVGSCLLLLFVSRYAVRKLVWHLVQAGYIGQRIVIYGADEHATGRVLRLLDLERLPYLSVIGIADGRTTRIDRDRLWGVPFLGDLDALLERVKRGDVDMVIIALPMIGQDRLDQITETLQSVSVDICLMPREAMDLSTQYRMRFIGSLPLFALWQRPIRDWDHIIKALEDRFLALGGLIILSPVLALAALAIKLTSPGPILFRQQRFGFNNVKIDVLKFRSMYVDQQDESGAERTVRGDPRVTPVGRIIRRLSIDELPQLYNVLCGEMSIVGPRPHATTMKVGDKQYFEAVKGYAARHRVKPGITGLAQVRGLRGEISTIERAKRRVEYDFYYIENWSLMLDIRIILETFYKLLWDHNAY
jgi:Undecaprenyl-phosphate glucose phosphotransferase